jgi:hypothetical protein
MKTIPKSVVLRCIASYLETDKANRALADCWHDRADMYADRAERPIARTPISGLL